MLHEIPIERERRLVHSGDDHTQKRTVLRRSCSTSNGRGCAWVDEHIQGFHADELRKGQVQKIRKEEAARTLLLVTPSQSNCHRRMSLW